MKQFFKFVLASMVGIFLISLIFIFVILIIIGASSDKTVEVESNSVLQMSFNYPIAERTPNNPLAALSFLGFDDNRNLGLNDILANIKKAKTDSNIKGIFLDEGRRILQ